MAGRKLKIEWSQEVFEQMRDCLDIQDYSEELIELAKKEINDEILRMEENEKR